MRVRVSARWAALLAIAVSATGLAACGSSDSGSSGGTATAASGGGGKKVVVYANVTGNASNPFFAVYIHGLQDAAKDLGVDVRVLTLQQYTEDKYVANLRSAVAAKPDGIVQIVVDPVAEQAPLKQAIASGISVVATIAGDTRPPAQRIPYLFNLGENPALSGAALADETIRAMASKPQKAVCFVGTAGPGLHHDRCASYTAGMQAAGVSASTVLGDPDPTRLATIIRGYLQSHSDVRAVCVMGPTEASAAASVIRALGLTGKVGLTSFDLSSDQLNLIKSGDLIATSAQQQYLQGYMAVQAIKLQATHGLHPVGTVATGPLIVDRQNVDRHAAAIAANYE